MSISVGSVTVDIVPDTTNFRRDLNAKLKDLSAQVRADLDAKKFDAELDEATRDRKVNVKVDEKGSLGSAQKNSHALLTTLGLLAPAAAPLTAVALGGAAALGSLGAAGLLAVKGIQNEMKTGTPAGLVYTGMVKSLQGDLAVLEKTAADGIISGFSEAVQVADNAVPQLRTEVGLLSKSLGSDLAPILSGVFGLLHDLDPTINTISGGVHSLAVDFEEWANGPGGIKFANYLATELPVVAHTLEALGAAGAHLVSALLPLGGPVLGAIEGVSTAIAHIPVTVIQDLFVAFAAYKTITLAQAAVDGFSASLVKLGIVEKGLAVTGGGSGAKGLIPAAGGLLARVGITGAVAGVGGAIAGTVGAGIVGAQLIDQHQGGVNTKAANNLVAGGAPAIAAAQKQLAAYNAELAQQRAGELAAAQAGGINRNSAQGQAKSYGDLQAKADNLQDQIKLATSQISKNTAANLQAGLTADGTTDAITGEAVSMAKLISTADKLAGAEQGLYGAQINVHQAVSDANKALKENGQTLDLGTQKGRDNRTALLNVAAAQRAVIDADATTAAGRKHLNADTANSITQLETLAHKMGLSTTAAHNLADALLGIKSVKVTLTDAGYGPVRADLAHLVDLERQASGRGPTKATGGLLQGPGSGTSDSIVARVSNGEFVVNANATRQNLALLHKINSSTPAFAGGGMVGYASGGQVDANLSAITALLNQPYSTAANVAQSRVSEARATATLLSAESALDNLRRSKHTTAAEIDAAEKRITTDRLALSAATSKLSTTEASLAASRTPLITRYASSVASTVRTDGAFLANLKNLQSRGFGFFAQELLAQGDSQAMTTAAQAIKLGNSSLSKIQANLQKDANFQTQLQNFGASAAAPAPGVAVTNNITTNPGQSNEAIAQIVGAQLAILISR